MYSMNMLASDIQALINQAVASLICHHALMPYASCLFAGIRYDWPSIARICQRLDLAEPTVDVAGKVLA